jgi:transcriptional regulator with XRE-family HTH domain
MTHHGGLLRSYGRQLEAIRRESGMNQDEVARAMQCSAAKVSRMLSARRPPSWADITMLVTVMSASQEQSIALLRTWTAVRNTSPAFASFQDILTSAEIEYHEAVQYADITQISSGALFPVLLRVPQYHDAVIRTECVLNEASLRWRELLPLLQVSRNPRRELHLVLDESAFLRWRTPGFHDQLDALLQAHEAGISIQVLPLNGVVHAGMLQPFSILYWEDDPSATLMCVGSFHRPVDWVPEHLRRGFRNDWDALVALASAPSVLPAIVELAHWQREGCATRTVMPW